jgi:tetraacyldisaccharide 4'-kinase
MRPPGFWQRPGDGIAAMLLAPFGKLVAAATARRVARTGWQAPVPVICVGNVTLGGTGKTTVALDLGLRLHRQGARVHFLTRGYGGSVRGVHRVRPSDDARAVGDEALLLAEVAPTWVGADRAASARAAIAEGAEVLVMDDGLQNPTLMKEISLLVVDGAVGFGNGRVFPAGPLREPVAAGAARCQAAVLIGPDTGGARSALPSHLPILQARLVPSGSMASLAGRPVLAVAAIARPGKFFTMLEEAGIELAERAEFPDHHPFTASELRRLSEKAKRSGFALVTTPKDAVRLPSDAQAEFTVVGVQIGWEDEKAIDDLIRLAATPNLPRRLAGEVQE